MAPEDRPPTVPLTMTLRGGWLLVLGRQANVRTLLVRFFSQAGYAVTGCATLAEAEIVLKGKAPPAVILFDGEAANEAALRESLQQIALLLPLTPSYPVIVLSLAQPLPRSQYLTGAVTVVAQPFDLTDLLQLVASVSDSAPPGTQL